MTKNARSILLLIGAVAVLSAFCLASCKPSDSPSTAETKEHSATGTSEGLPPLDPPEPGTKKVAVITGAQSGRLFIKKMIEMTGKENPKCVILTTAGKDKINTIEDAVEKFSEFTDSIEVITLCTKLYDPLELRTTIVEADLLYEVGGQSEFMRDTWEKYDVDEYVPLAYERGVVVCGGSAGGMCWTYAAWNDFDGLPDPEYKWFYGIDALHMYYGPHFKDNEEWERFHEELLAIKSPKYNIGYAMEGDTGMVIVDGEVTEYLRDDEESFIWRYVFEGGEWTCTRIEEYTAD